jgi:hypothetical protein
MKLARPARLSRAVGTSVRTRTAAQLARSMDSASGRLAALHAEDLDDNPAAADVDRGWLSAHPCGVRVKAAVAGSPHEYDLRRGIGRGSSAQIRVSCGT